MLYVIVGRDAPGALAARQRARPAHLVRAQRLVSEGRMIFAGPCPAMDSATPGPAGFTGSVIIAEFESLEAAREWTAADPYVTEGVFESWEVRPIVKSLP